MEAREVLDWVKELLVGAVINGTEVSRYILAMILLQDGRSLFPHHAGFLTFPNEAFDSLLQGNHGNH